MQTEGKMQTDNCRPGVKCRLSSKTTYFPRKKKTLKVSWDGGRLSREKLSIVIMVIDVSNSTSSDNSA